MRCLIVYIHVTAKGAKLLLQVPEVLCGPTPLILSSVIPTETLNLPLKLQAQATFSQVCIVDHAWSGASSDDINQSQ